MAIISQNVDKGKLFVDKKNADLYWEALIQIGKNNVEGAKKLAAAINSNDYIVLFPKWKEDRPEDIDAFFDKLFLSSVARSPQLLSFLNLFESIGIYDHNVYLDEISPKIALEQVGEDKVYLQTLQTYPLENLNSDQKISYKVFSWRLRHAIQGEKFLFHRYLVHQMYSVIHDITSTFTLFHKLDTSQDIENYIVRLNKIQDQLRQAAEWMECQRERDIIPPKFALEKVFKMIEKLIEANLLYTTLAEKAGSPLQLQRAKGVIEICVYPAFRVFQAYLNKISEMAPSNDGVWVLADGEAYYSYMLQHHTTTDLTADEIHALGLKEVFRVTQEIREILTEEKVASLEEMSKDARFYYPNTEEGRKECLAQFEAILERSRKELWPLFDIKPKASVMVQRIPEYEEAGAPGAYYRHASMDGTRPGVFYANLRNMHEIPKYGMETLAVHEAEPGHHFQCTIQNEIDIPLLRKIDGFTAYAEGWALYTEKLAYEEGFYSTPFDELGHLQGELLRAVRLVVDTGIHSKRWTCEEAIEYMEKMTGMGHEEVATEVERYFVIPGQACAYKIGQLKILELRQRAKDKLGDKFDIREFHNTVLKVGAVPLTILEEVVNEYIGEKNGN